MLEEVVLVNEKDKKIGVMEKSKVHTKNTPLHRAFSLFLFRSKDKKVLLQRRSKLKKTWPLVWSNSCCGHPLPNETRLKAVRRRAKYEIGIDNFIFLKKVVPYRYCFERDGVVENEICPIYLGITTDEFKINKDEVEECKWLKWKDFKNKALDKKNDFSEWCQEELLILEKTKEFKKYIN